MRFASLVLKYAKENLRSWAMLALVLLLAPMIIAIFYAASGSRAEQYRIGVLDRGSAPAAGGEAYRASALVEALRGQAAEAKATIEVLPDPATAERRLADKAVDLLMILPADFAAAMADAAAGGPSKPRIAFRYDPKSPRSTALFGLAYTAAVRHILSVTGRELPFEIEEEFVQPIEASDPFAAGAYIPSFLILSILNVLFLAASTMIREVEHGTMRRIALSRVTSFELIGAISLVQLVVCIAGLALSLGTAYLFGYRPGGSLPAFLLVGALCGLSMMAFSAITACFCRSVKDVWIVGNFPYMLCLFFSGFIPLPTSTLFSLCGRPVTFSSFIPLSHGIKALDRLLNGNGSLADIAFELVAILVLTAAYFAVGISFFYRRHLRLR
jgi:ABC-2 type transport system permease protein